MMNNKQTILKELQTIPGIGKACAQDLYNLGFRSVHSLKGKDPEELYLKLCALQNKPVDRCMLFVLRCAVYYASHETHDPEKLKWWNWKDGKN